MAKLEAGLALVDLARQLRAQVRADRRKRKLAKKRKAKVLARKKKPASSRRKTIVRGPPE